MPVSRTATDSTTGSPGSPRSSTRTSTTTSPCSVNLTALASRLASTWRSRVTSPSTRSGQSRSTWQTSSRPLAAAGSATSRRALSTQSRRENGACSSSSSPDSILEKSSTSSMIASRFSPLSWTVCTNSRWSSSSRVSSSRSVIPITAFIGVRISWLIVARNADFAAFAASASSRARVISSAVRLRSVTSSETPQVAYTTAVRVAQGELGGLEPALPGGAVRPFLHRDRAGQGPLVVAPPDPRHLRVEPGVVAAEQVALADPERRREGRVRQQVAALQVLDVDQRLAVGDDAAQHPVVGVALALQAQPLGGVAHVQRAADLDPAVVDQRRDADPGRHDSAGAGAQPPLHRLRQAGGQRPVDDVAQRRLLQQQVQRPAEALVGGPAGQLVRRGVPARHGTAVVERQHRVGRRLHDLRERAGVVLRAQPLSHVAHEGVRVQPGRRVQGRQHQLDRDVVPVAVLRGQQSRTVGQVAHPGRHQAGVPEPVRLAVARRDDQQRQVGPEGLVAAPAEQALRRRVPVGHPAGRVHPDERVRGGLQDGLEGRRLPSRAALGRQQVGVHPLELAGRLRHPCRSGHVEISGRHILLSAAGARA